MPGTDRLMPYAAPPAQAWHAGASGVGRRLYKGNSFNPPRPVWQSIHRAWSGHCPACGTHPSESAACGACGFDPSLAEPGGAIPLFAGMTAFVVAMAVGYGLEVIGDVLGDNPVPVWLAMALAMVVAGTVAWSLVARVRRVTEALQWSLWMHGFDPDQPRPHAVARDRRPETKAVAVLGGGPVAVPALDPGQSLPSSA